MTLLTTALTLLIAARGASADVVEFEDDREGWFAVAGPVETIGFTGFPWGTRIDEQYAAFGVQPPEVCP